MNGNIAQERNVLEMSPSRQSNRPTKGRYSRSTLATRSVGVRRAGAGAIPEFSQNREF